MSLASEADDTVRHTLNRTVGDLVMARRFSLVAMLGMAFLIATATCEALTDEELLAQVTTYRDTWGIPHLFAESEEALFFGHGYFGAERAVGGILREILKARGKLAEYFGEEHLESDYRMRLFRVAAVADERYEEIPAQARRAIEAYVRGINCALSRQRDRLPEWARSVTARDIVATSRLHLPRPRVFEEVFGFNPAMPEEEQRGSNSFVLSPEKTADGRTVLVADPHAFWMGKASSEMHLCGGEFDVIGQASSWLINIGHSRRLAFGGSANGPDTVDVYEEKLNPENHLQYLYDGAWCDIKVREEALRVKTDDGMKTVMKTMMYTHHGPITRVDEKNHRAFSVRISEWDALTDMASKYSMYKARSITEVKEAMQTLDITHVPNAVVADIDGNIFYVWYTRCPKRSEKYDWSKPVPGWTSETEWGEPIPFHGLPQVENPRSHFLQTSNEAPWFVTPDSGLSREQIPPYLVPIKGFHTGQTDRGIRLTQLLEPASGLTVDDVKRIAWDTYIMKAELLKPKILSAYESLKGEWSDPQGHLARAIRVLRDWDNRADVDSRGTALFTLCTEQLVKGRRDLSNAKALVNAFQAAVDYMIEHHGTVDIEWGKVHVIKRGQKSYPVPGGTQQLQTAHMASGRLAEDGIRYCNNGSGYKFVAFLGDHIESYSATPYGSSADPSSPHFADATELYSQGKFKRLYYEKQDILEHLESAWGTRIQLGTKRLGFTAEVRSKHPRWVDQAISSEPPGVPLPADVKPASVFVSLSSKDHGRATVALRCYLDREQLGSATLWVHDGDRWREWEGVSRDEKTPAVAAEGLPLGTYVAAVPRS